MSELFEITVQSASGNYFVRVQLGLADKTQEGVNILCVCDSNVHALYPQVAANNSIIIEASERKKSLSSVAEMIESMRSLGGTRHTTLRAYGGGIVQDLCTFAASSYMRGIKWEYVPTTLLGMVDSCIGGKSSLNVGRYKNIAGNFYPPQTIFIDPNFCRSLSTAQIVEGLCEAAKICFADASAGLDMPFERYLKLFSDSVSVENESFLLQVIVLSLTTKKRFIEEDEFDKGIRLTLNFGHTFGHAIEAASHFSISHGTAVGLGMIAAIHFSQSQSLCEPTHPRISRLINHLQLLLSEVPNLANHVLGLDPEDFYTHFCSDKKHTHNNFILILPDKNGCLMRYEIPLSPNSRAEITQSLSHLKTYFS